MAVREGRGWPFKGQTRQSWVRCVFTTCNSCDFTSASFRNGPLLPRELLAFPDIAICWCYAAMQCPSPGFRCPGHLPQAVTTPE